MDRQHRDGYPVCNRLSDGGGGRCLGNLSLPGGQLRPGRRGGVRPPAEGGGHQLHSRPESGPHPGELPRAHVLGLRVVLAVLLSRTALGPLGIWCAWPIGWTIASAMSILFYRSRRISSSRPAPRPPCSPAASGPARPKADHNPIPYPAQGIPRFCDLSSHDFPVRPVGFPGSPEAHTLKFS